MEDDGWNSPPESFHYDNEEPKAESTWIYDWNLVITCVMDASCFTDDYHLLSRRGMSTVMLSDDLFDVTLFDVFDVAISGTVWWLSFTWLRHWPGSFIFSGSFFVPFCEKSRAFTDPIQSQSQFIPAGTLTDYLKHPAAVVGGSSVVPDQFWLNLEGFLRISWESWRVL